MPIKDRKPAMSLLISAFQFPTGHLIIHIWTHVAKKSSVIASANMMAINQIAILTNI